MNSSAQTSRSSLSSGQVVMPPDIVEAPLRLTYALSTSVTVAFRSAARRSAQHPAKPPPMIRTSVSRMSMPAASAIIASSPSALLLRNADGLHHRRPVLDVGGKHLGGLGSAANRRLQAGEFNALGDLRLLQD